jgi:glycerol-3-phosphate dehydrogenase
MSLKTIAADAAADNTWTLETVEEYAQTVVRINDAISSDAEETEAQPLDGLSLADLETLFDREMDRADNFQAAADCLAHRSTVSLFRAGRVMAAIRHILKSQGKWTKWQKAHKVGVTSAWQAIQLVEKAGSEKAVAGLTRTEALKKFLTLSDCRYALPEAHQ